MSSQNPHKPSPRGTGRNNVRTMLENSFRRYGNNTAIIERNTYMSYSLLGQTVKSISRGLLEAGIVKGDRVGIESSNRDLIILALAVIHSGACAVIIPEELTESEKRTLMTKCFISAIISNKRYPLSKPLMDNFTADELTKGYSIFRTASKSASNSLKSPLIKNAVIIRFTSGTTGTSKGILLTHASVIERIHAANKGLGIKEKDVILWVLPMSYHFIVSILLYLSAGACIVLPENHSPETLKNAFKKYKVSVLYASEHLFRAMLSDCARNDLQSLVKAFSTTSALSEKTAADFYHKFGIPIRQAYGIIEVGLPFVNNADPVNKPKSVGKVSDDYKVKILDTHGNKIKNFEAGKVFIKGPGFFDAYLSPFRTKKEICEHGWFRTGDIGKIDDEGFLHLYGRSGNVINCMGMKIFPSEIEEILNTHPSVREALVKAKPHPYLNEVPHALIVLNKGSEKPEHGDLTAYCSKYLAAYKVPRSFECVDSLPKTKTGKIKRS